MNGIDFVYHGFFFCFHFVLFETCLVATRSNAGPLSFQHKEEKEEKLIHIRNLNHSTTHTDIKAKRKKTLSLL